MEELADQGSAGFRASYVAQEAGLPEKTVRQALASLVDDEDLDVQYELLCPDNGRTIATYREDDELPIGEEVASDKCDSDTPFVVGKNHLWVSFVPSRKLLSRVNRERAGGGKKNGRVAVATAVLV